MFGGDFLPLPRSALSSSDVLFGFAIEGTLEMMSCDAFILQIRKPRSGDGRD